MCPDLSIKEVFWLALYFLQHRPNTTNLQKHSILLNLFKGLHKTLTLSIWLTRASLYLLYTISGCLASFLHSSTIEYSASKKKNHPLFILTRSMKHLKSLNLMELPKYSLLSLLTLLSDYPIHKNIKE